MGDVRYAVLVPNDPALLADGLCGFRPPVASEWDRWIVGRDIYWAMGRSRAQEGLPTDRQALVLACDGEPLLVGCHVAYPGGTEYLIVEALEKILEGDLSPLPRLRRVLRDRGTLLLLDGRGCEVSDV